MATYSSSKATTKEETDAINKADSDTKWAAAGEGALQGGITGAGIGAVGGPVGVAIGAAAGAFLGMAAGALGAEDEDAAQKEADEKRSALVKENQAKMLSSIDSTASSRSLAAPAQATATSIGSSAATSTASRNTKRAGLPYDTWNSSVYGG